MSCTSYAIYIHVCKSSISLSVSTTWVDLTNSHFPVPGWNASVIHVHVINGVIDLHFSFAIQVHVWPAPFHVASF